MFGRRGNRNGIETCGNGKEWKSWKPFSHTSMLEWLVFPEPWIFGCDFQFVWVWKKNARRYSCIKVTIKTKYILSAIATLGQVSCTHLSIISLYKNSSVLMFPGSLSSNMWANLAKWQLVNKWIIVEIIWIRINECLGSCQKVFWG